MPNPLEPKEQSESDVHVQFTVKELLARIDGKIDIITGLVHEKADKADLTRLEFRVGTLEKASAERKEVELVENRVIKLEKETATTTAVESNRVDMEKFNAKLKWIVIGVVSSTALGLGSIAVALLHTH